MNWVTTSPLLREFQFPQERNACPTAIVIRHPPDLWASTPSNQFEGATRRKKENHFFVDNKNLKG